MMEDHHTLPRSADLLECVQVLAARALQQHGKEQHYLVAVTHRRRRCHEVVHVLDVRIDAVERAKQPMKIHHLVVVAAGYDRGADRSVGRAVHAAKVSESSKPTPRGQ